MMDQQTYDQFAMTPDQLGDTVLYLKENGELDVQFYGEEPVGVELPITLEFEVTGDGSRLSLATPHPGEPNRPSWTRPDHSGPALCEYRGLRSKWTRGRGRTWRRV